MIDNDVKKDNNTKKHETISIAICRLDETENLLNSLLAEITGQDRLENEVVEEKMSNLMDFLDKGSEQLDAHRSKMLKMIKELRTILFG